MSLLDLAARFDGFINRVTGIGIAGSDRSVGTRMESDPILTAQELADLFRFDPLSRKIVSIYPSEALRRGIGSSSDFVRRELTRLSARVKIERAATWGRLYGGGVIVMGIRDGRPCHEPLLPPPEGQRYRIDFLDDYDRRSVTREQSLEIVNGERVTGEAQMLRINPPSGDQFWVHRSRCLIFGGATTGDQERLANAGWDDSILQCPYQVILKFAAGHGAVGNMLTDAASSVFKIKGLIAAVTGNKEIAIDRRLALLDLYRSVTRAIWLDADGGEEFEKLSTDFTGVPDVLDRLANLVAASTDIPVTILIGQAPAGLNATGEADTRSWYARVESYREQNIDPCVDRLLDLIEPGAAPSWPSLWTPTDQERAATTKTVAETDAIYMADGVYTPEEIRQARGPR